MEQLFSWECSKWSTKESLLTDTEEIQNLIMFNYLITFVNSFFLFPHHAKESKSTTIFTRFETLCRPISLVTSFAIWSQSTTRVTFRGNIHGFGEGAGEISIEVNHPPDIVVELSNKTHISAQVVRHLGFMVLVNLIDEQPVLVQNVLDLNKTLLKCLQHLAIHLSSITKSWKCVTIHFFLFFSPYWVRTHNVIKSTHQLLHQEQKVKRSWKIKNRGEPEKETDFTKITYLLIYLNKYYHNHIFSSVHAYNYI